MLTPSEIAIDKPHAPRPSRRAWLACAALACANPAWAWSDRPKRTTTQLRVGGTGAAKVALQRLTSDWQREQGVELQVMPELGSTGGIAALLAGGIDVAMSNRPPRASDGAIQGLRVLEYARTPFALAVHHRLGVQELSLGEVAALFAEGAARFPNGARARPVLRSPSAGASDKMRALSPQIAIAYDRALLRRGMLHAATDTEAAELIEQVPGAFAGLTLAQLLQEGRPHVALHIDGRAPTLAHLASGRWPHGRLMYAIARADSPAVAHGLLDHLRSPRSRALLLAGGYLPWPPT